jgi:hypothetical protein
VKLVEILNRLFTPLAIWTLQRSGEKHRKKGLDEVKNVMREKVDMARREHNREMSGIGIKSGSMVFI